MITMEPWGEFKVMWVTQSEPIPQLSQFFTLVLAMTLFYAHDFTLKNGDLTSGEP